jgi:hypothetical protein
MNEDFRNRGDHGRSVVTRPGSTDLRIHTELTETESKSVIHACANWIDSHTGSHIGPWMDSLKKPQTNK